MSFSSEVKEELSRQSSSGRHCLTAELAAIILYCGGVSIAISASDRISLKVQTEHIYVARKFCSLVRKLLHIDCEVSAIRKKGNGRTRTLYRVLIARAEDAGNVLSAVGLSEDRLRPDESLTRRNCCRRAFVRGAILAAGSFSDPKKFYHFEVVCPDEESALYLQTLMAGLDLDARIVTRKQHRIVYLKEGSQIVDILGLTEAHKALMEFENVRILREITGNINRKVNCETANIGKTVSAAVRQLEDIRYVEAHLGFENLPENLEEAARARLRYPDAPLKDLGAMMMPPVGKSGINHRLKKISAIAESMRASGNQS